MTAYLARVVAEQRDQIDCLWMVGGGRARRNVVRDRGQAAADVGDRFENDQIVVPKPHGGRCEKLETEMKERVRKREKSGDVT